MRTRGVVWNRSRGKETRIGIAVAAIILLTSAALSLLVPVASAATFPVCSLEDRMEMYITFNPADAPSGAFTVAGCTYPFGYAVEIWFRVGSNPGLGNPIAGLPTTADPLVLQSGWTDGHFHETLVLPADAPNRVLVNSMLITPYRAPVGYYYETDFLVRAPNFVPSGGNEAYTQKAPGHKTPQVAVAWAPAGSSPGAFTFLGTTDANGAHVRVWFEDAGNGSAIGGMYSSAAPWLGSLANTRFFLSFIIPADLTIDLTRPNITIKMLVLETGTTIAYTIWVHRMV